MRDRDKLDDSGSRHKLNRAESAQTAAGVFSRSLTVVAEALQAIRTCLIDQVSKRMMRNDYLTGLIFKEWRRMGGDKNSN